MRTMVGTQEETGRLVPRRQRALEVDPCHSNGNVMSVVSLPRQRIALVPCHHVRPPSFRSADAHLRKTRDTLRR